MKSILLSMLLLSSVAWAHECANECISGYVYEVVFFSPHLDRYRTAKKADPDGFYPLPVFMLLDYKSIAEHCDMLCLHDLDDKE